MEPRGLRRSATYRETAISAMPWSDNSGNLWLFGGITIPGGDALTTCGNLCRPFSGNSPGRRASFIGVNVTVHAVTAFWAAAKTSPRYRTSYPLRAPCPRLRGSIHPAFTASNISSAGPV